MALSIGIKKDHTEKSFGNRDQQGKLGGGGGRRRKLHGFQPLSKKPDPFAIK